MPRLLTDGAEQVVATVVLDQLEPFLVRYGQQGQGHLVTEARYPLQNFDYQRFWLLVRLDLAVLLTARSHPEEAGQTVLQLFTTAAPIATLMDDLLINPGLDPEDRASLLTLRATLTDTPPTAQAAFMLAWLEMVGQTLQAVTCQPVQERLDRQLDRSLLLNQVVTKIQESLDLSVILQTTVSEVRQFLQADRILIYQFDLAKAGFAAAPAEASQGASETAAASGLYPNEQGGYITYEARSSEALASVLHHTEDFCFRESPHCRDRYGDGNTIAIDDVNLAYANQSCLHDFLIQVGVKSKVIAPILVGQRLWGLLIVHQCVTQRHWEPWEIEFLGHIAEHLAIAINQAQLYHQLQQQTQNLEVCVIERTQDLRDALAAAQAANRAKSDFLATMSHELRTPLTYIIGMSATLLRWSLGDLSDRQRDYLNTIHTSGEHLLAVINDILEVSKIESGRTALEVREFSLTSLSRQSVDAFRAEAAKAGLDVVLDLKITPDQDSFMADPRRVRQILSNLLSNAIKFTPAEGKITLRVRHEQNAAVFQVKDTGIGIPESAQQLLFEKFQQLENVRQREHQGTGLGLALTKQLVELHGGSIKVVSEVGMGSTFTVRIPRQRLAEPGAALPPPPATEPVVGRIVLVEDNEESASVICDMLTAADYQVIWVMDGSRVLDQVELLQPAAVVINASLASADGHDIMAALRQSVSYEEVKILALLDTYTPKQEHKAHMAGANETLPYPIDPQQLLLTINRMMSQPNPPRSPLLG